MSQMIKKKAKMIVRAIMLKTHLGHMTIVPYNVKVFK